MNLRDGFRDIVSGHLLVDSFDAVTDIIEESAKWVDANGGLEACTDDERATIKFMIERQMALAEREGITVWSTPHTSSGGVDRSKVNKG
jgi:hypothetical protein